MHAAGAGAPGESPGNGRDLWDPCGTRRRFSLFPGVLGGSRPRVRGEKQISMGTRWLGLVAAGLVAIAALQSPVAGGTPETDASETDASETDAGEQQGAPTTAAGPTQEELEAARAEVRAKVLAWETLAAGDASATGFAARTNWLLREAASPTAQPIWQEACLWEAADASRKAVEVGWFDAICARLGAFAHVDVDRLRSETVATWLSAAGTPLASVRKAALECIADCLWMEDLATARDLVAKLRPRIFDLDDAQRQHFAALQEGILSVELSFEAREQLARDPADPKALFDLGSYLALERGDAAGLSLLERGRDRTLGQLLTRERDPAVSVDAAQDLAERWFTWASTQPKGPRRSFGSARAVDWYFIARLHAPARQLDSIDRRIDRAAASLPSPRAVWSRAAPAPRHVDTRRALPQARRTVGRAVRFLVAHQQPDGSWSSHAFAARCDPLAHPACTGFGNEGRDVGITSLALNALIASGEEEAKAPVLRGIRWLIERADPKTGRIADMGKDFGYSLALSTMALARAMQAGWVERQSVEEPLERCVAEILSTRLPYASWGYSKGSSFYHDTSTNTWMVLALSEYLRTQTEDRQTEMREAFVGALRWYEEALDASTGVFGYVDRGGTPARTERNASFQDQNRHSMTASGLLGTLVAREMVRPTDEKFSLDRTLTVLARGIPGTKEAEPYRDLYGRYMAVAALQQGGAYSRELLRLWYLAAAQELDDSQELSHCARGSWKPNGPWGHAGGRIYATSMGVLLLTAPWQSELPELTSEAR